MLDYVLPFVAEAGFGLDDAQTLAQSLGALLVGKPKVLLLFLSF